jgi:Flp pilus assembly protein TadG
MAVEFVIAAPALVLLMLLVAAGGQWLSASGDVSAAARDAARAASLARVLGDAQGIAQQVAQNDLNGICPGAASANVQPVGGDFATAPDVQVTVSCVVNLSAFRDIGFNVSQTFTDSATVPLDPFVNRGN